MSNILLQMKHIVKEFPGVRALDDVNFDVDQGEILSLVGENGAGKSTLMKILSGAYSHEEYTGEILVNGEPKLFKGPLDSEECGIQMIYQETSAIFDMNIAENIFIGRYPQKKGKGIDWRKVYHDAKEALEKVGLDISPREMMRNLSTSQQQLVAIAKAISANPKILVLDEPTSTLTKAESETLFEVLYDLKSRGIACIYISHKLDEVFKISDRIFVLRDGTTQGEFSKDNFNRDLIVQHMVGREIKDMFPKETCEIGDEVMRVENVTVTHPYNPLKNIVEGASFSLHKGEILGLAGLVGSGRSELVNAIFGAQTTKSSCDIYIEGKKAKINGPRDAMKYGLGLATEDRKKDGVVLIETIRENISLPSLDKISSKGRICKNLEKERVQQLYDSLNIKAQSMETKVLNLSGGNQQKVVIAKWLNTDLKVLILDEPTRGIDVGAKVEIYNIMCTLAKQGVGIIMISSELPELMAMCDRFLVLSEGKIKAEFNRGECDEVSIIMAAT